MAMIVNVCGNIASGKSTLVAALIDRFSLPAIIEDTKQISLFESYCADPRKWALAAQMQFMTIKVVQMLGALGSEATVVDRSLHEDFHVFSAVHRQLGNITIDDFELLRSVYETSLKVLKFREFNILVSCSPEEQRRRITRRGVREQEMLHKGYLDLLATQYSRFQEGLSVDYYFNSETDSVATLFGSLDSMLSSS